MIWSAFYEQLETSEANAFFAALTPVKLDAGELLTQQGDVLTDLIFIDQGYADISRPDDGTRLVFAPLQAGDVIGSEGFFDGLPWELNVAAQTEIQVRLLKKEPFRALADDLPEIAAKLESFCRSSDVLPALVRQAAAGAALPDESMIEIDGGPVLFTDGGGAASDRDTTAQLAHTGNGGFSIVFTAAHLDKPKHVLGHQVSVELAFASGSTATSFAFIAGGGYYAEAGDRLFVHVRFYHPVEEEHYTCRFIRIM